MFLVGVTNNRRNAPLLSASVSAGGTVGESVAPPPPPIPLTSTTDLPPVFFEDDPSSKAVRSESLSSDQPSEESCDGQKPAMSVSDPNLPVMTSPPSVTSSAAAAAAAEADSLLETFAAVARRKTGSY
jgi:hypothetical protein